MISSKRQRLLGPGQKSWDSYAVFNPSLVKKNDRWHMLYRSMGVEEEVFGEERLRVSRIASCVSKKVGQGFVSQKVFIEPEAPWESFGCEDPRTTFFEGYYYTFYTALGGYPFAPHNVRVGLAISENLDSVDQKYLLTPFNAKAMTLFPERINGKITALLTVNSDQPPATIALFQCDKIEEMWDPNTWYKWYGYLGQNALQLQRLNTDHVEVGSVPIAFDGGWLLIYAHILDYSVSTLTPFFGVEAVLLDKNNPQHIIARTQEALFYPELPFEMEGTVPNVIFPTSVTVDNEQVAIYYGGADTCIAKAVFSLDEFRSALKCSVRDIPKGSKLHVPIIEPRSHLKWEQNGTFNPGVWDDGESIHILYRAQSDQWTSTLGYARLNTPYSIIERHQEPCYLPREAFEKKLQKTGYSGCEDPRLTAIDGFVYMLYTAFDGINAPRIALTKISELDFKNHNWLAWEKPKLISKPGIMNKNSMLFPEKVNGEYIIVHRIETSIYIEKLSPEEFHTLGTSTMLQGKKILTTPHASWNQGKVGANSPPHKTSQGWLLLYHGVDGRDRQYRLGVMLLDLKDPTKILAMSPYPILEPELPWEKYGVVNNVVFPCGSVVRGERLYIYYGAADKYVGIASLDISEVLDYLVSSSTELNPT